MDVWIDTQWNNISKYMKNTLQILLKKYYPRIQLQHRRSTLKYISNIRHGESTWKILMLPSKIEDQSKYLQPMNLYIYSLLYLNSDLYSVDSSDTRYHDSLSFPRHRTSKLKTAFSYTATKFHNASRRDGYKR